MKFHRIRCLLVVLLGLCTLGAADHAVAESLADNRRELEQIRQRIERLAADLEKGQRKQSALEEDLRVVGRQLTRLRAREEQHAGRLQAVKREISDSQEAIAALEKQSRGRKELVARRLSALYRGGSMRMLRLLFADRSPAAMARDYYLMKRVVEHDRQLLTAFRRDREALAQQLATLEGLRRERTQQLDELAASRQALQRARQVKKRLLTKLQRRQDTMNDELAGLEEKRARLMKLVKRLETAPASNYTQSSGNFAREKGRLPWPVKGHIKVAFGTGRLAGLGTMYDSQGVEIQVSGKQSIHAIWEGRVIFANNFRGYGNMIIVDHGDNYYSLYAQASSLQKKVGEPVKAGELLGYPGYEDADSVYFEIRHHGTPLNPLSWLKPSS